MSDLESLLDALRREPGEASYPPPVPRADQSVPEWLGELTERRAEADAGALDHRHRIAQACQELFGTTVSELLPDAELTPTLARVDVPAHPRLRDLVDLPPGAPADPEPVRAVPERRQIDVWITSPAAPSATIVRMHGGAFWMGGGALLNAIDQTLIGHVAAVANAAVIDVDYRLAPEYPYPAAVVDTLTVIDAVRSGSLGPVAGPIGLMGTSSGGNSVTMVARLDAMRGGEIAALGLQVPSVMLDAGPQSADADAAAWEVRRELLRGYLGEIDPGDPWVSPGVLDRLDGMPPTFAIAAEYDEVAAGAERLCAAIRAAGQSAESRTYPMTHVVAAPEVEAAYTRDLAEFFRAHLA